MPNKAKNPGTGKHDEQWAEERHRKQAGNSTEQQQGEEAPRRQQGGWSSDEEVRDDQSREPGQRRDRDYNPDGERPIDNR